MRTKSKISDKQNSDPAKDLNQNAFVEIGKDSCCIQQSMAESFDTSNHLCCLIPFPSTLPLSLSLPVALIPELLYKLTPPASVHINFPGSLLFTVEVSSSLP
ncbi:hypothetical protein OPV22_003832 [Ensete ventricosum]|uniref:Uncharacterized protein n=1 Tax=Ensete ventricosum TaxID=4639 RepID=A0AAV8S1Z5_ENSVE|nr:hypothetical protein OPV22_003832 [Ensete ventricosum]